MFVALIASPNLLAQKTVAEFGTGKKTPVIKRTGHKETRFDPKPNVKIKISNVHPNPAGDNASFSITAKKDCELEIKMRDPNNVVVLYKKLQLHKGTTEIPLKLYAYKAGRYSLAVRHRKQMSIQYIDIVK